MVTPISSDKILPSDSTRRSISDNKSAGQSELIRPDTVATPSTQDETTSTEENSLDVERANQIFSQSQSQASSREDSISTPDQARSAAAELKAQIAGNTAQALQAQAGPASANLSALLEAAPT